jgi:hypothetical protein
MKAKIFLVMIMVFLTTALAAETYICSNSRYHIQLYNHQSMGHTATAIIFQDHQNNREVTFRAQDVNYVVTFGAEYSASTFGQAIHEITLSIGNFDIPQGQSTTAMLTIRSRYGEKVDGIGCTRGGDQLPSMF